MQRITIDKVQYTLPTKWEDVTLGKYIELINAKDLDPTARFSVLTGIPYKTLLSLDDESLMKVGNVCSFMFTSEIELYLMPPRFNFDPAKLPWGKLEKFKQELKALPADVDQINLAAKMLVIYRPAYLSFSYDEKYYLSLPITEILNDIRFFFRHTEGFAGALKCLPILS